ncbi:unnamed protein product [Heterobilharzia americana]|nr:unnamed protein product [Heterobilharzia americana]
MLMNLNNFMQTLLPKSSTPTKELSRADYMDESADNSSIKTDLLNAYTNTFSPICSPTKNTTHNNASSKNVNNNDNQPVISSNECKSNVDIIPNDESSNKSTNSSKDQNSIETLQGYTLINNQDNLETNGLKMRLLAALADMIPHDESLSLRLLMSYTIDDQESECVVIDETLCRETKREEVSDHNSYCHLSNNTKIRKILEDEKKAELTEIPAQSLFTRGTPLGSVALDLSLHTEISDPVDCCVDSVHAASPKEGNNAKLSTASSNVDAVLNEIKSSLNTCSTPLSLLSTSFGQSNLTATKASESVTTTAVTTPVNQIPQLDTTLLALLPLLQQQQSANILAYQNVVNPNSLSLISTPISQSVATVSSAKQNQIPFNLTGTSTNANLLFNQLYASNATHMQQNTNQMNNLLPTNLSSILPKQAEPPTTTSQGNTITSPLMNNVANNQSLLNSASIIGFPLFNPFSINANNINNSSNVDNFSGLLPPTSYLGTASTLTQSHTLPQSNVSSSNLGTTNTTATLFSLKDKQIGLIETVGVMPSMKNLNQPIASLINQLSVNSSNNISLKTLSTLSQLFGNAIPTNNVTGNSSPTTNFNITNNHNTNITIPAIISTNVNNNHISLGADDLTLAKNYTKKSSSSGKSSNRSSPLYSTNGHTSITTSKLNHSIENKKDIMKSPTSVIQKKESTNGDSAANNNNNTNFLFGRRLAHSRRFICNQCRRNFSSLAELNRHTIEAHNSFRCTICSAHFTQRSNLQRHSLKHVGFKPFTCNLCKKEYYRKDHLVRHIEVTHPTHDPKMNITVHLTSSECLDYLDRLHAGKQTPSPPTHSQSDKDMAVTATTANSISNTTPDKSNDNKNREDDFDLMNDESMKIEEAKLETPDVEMHSDNDNNLNTDEDVEGECCDATNYSNAD